MWKNCPHFMIHKLNVKHKQKQCIEYLKDCTMSVKSLRKDDEGSATSLTVIPAPAPQQTDQVEDDDDRQEDTLYEVTDLLEFTGRRAEPEDIIQIKKFLRHEDYEFFKFEDPNVLFERLCFSIVISDNIEPDRIVAAAFFDDRPVDQELKTFAKIWKTGTLEKLTPTTTFYMRLFACSPEFQTDVLLTEIIGYTFAACYTISHLVVELPDLNNKGPFDFNKLVKDFEINPSGNKKKRILLYDKEILFPSLRLREGREHDLDDLAPLLPINTETIVKEFGRGVLSDIIALGDKQNQSMVGEWNHEAVAILTVTTDVNYGLLNDFYHLDLFHGLFKPHANDTVEIVGDEKQHIAGIPIPEVLQEAKRIMEAFKHLTAKRKNVDDTLPYTVEKKREDASAHYESDDIGLSAADEPFRARHQFCASVSEDIILYGLREPSEISSSTADRRSILLSHGDNLKSISAAQSPTDMTEIPGETDDPEEEEEEGESKLEGRLSLSNVGVEQVPPVVNEEEDEVDAVETEEANEIDPKISSEEAVGDENEEAEWNEETLVDFLTEFVEDEAEDDKTELEHGTGIQLEDLNLDLMLKPVVPESEEVADIPEEGQDEDEAESDEEAPTIDEVQDELELEEPADESNISTWTTKSEISKSVSAMTFNLRRKSQQQKSRKTNKNIAAASMAPSATMLPQIQSSTSMAFFQNKLELYKRLSDDTVFLGKTGTNKAFEEKVELMKRVWEVYMYMKQEGLTFEAAKIYLTSTELGALEEADMLTKGNLLKFLTILLPDEKMYPFERPVKAKVPTYYGLPNGIAIKIFSIEKKFSLRSLDMFRDIFKYFPNREYLIVTVPQGSKEPGWLDHFVRVVPRVDSSYPMELFVMHKAYLTSRLKVRRAKVTDIPNVIRLLSTIQDKDKILEDFKRSVCCKDRYAFVVQVKNHVNTPIVGMAVASDETQCQLYNINYELDKHTYFVHHEEKDHAYIQHLIIYPIFQRFSRNFTKEIMRMMKKTCMYQRIYPDFCINEKTKHQSLLNNLEDWIPVMPKKRVHYNFLNLTNDEYDLARLPPSYATNYKDPFSLIYFGKKFAIDQKVNINSRIVFVGASETTLACVEKMISSSFRGFRRITIIDTYGLPGELEPSKPRDEFFAMKKGGKSMSFESSSEWVQRMGLRNWVTSIVGTVTRIEREKKHVVVNKERVVPFDVLVIATGRQFQRIDCPEPEIDDPNFISFKKKAKANLLQGTPILTFTRETPKPKNVFTVNHEVEAEVALNFIKNYMPFMKRKKILIYGDGLRVFATVKALLIFGIPAKRIVLISPPEHETEWQLLAGYAITNTVRIPMEQELKRHGVHVVENYEFSEWETCPISGLVKRSYFASPTEIESRISFPTFALFCFRHRRVNDEIVSALAESYIVYQDGIIIDESFKTNDPCIYAAGPCATYKRILLARHQDHLFYQSEEVGQKLAEFLIDRTGSAGGGISDVKTLEVIQFKRPFVRAIVLLGGWHYLFMRSPGGPLSMRCFDPNGKCDEACECTTEIVTGSVDLKQDKKQKYFKIRLNDQSRIVGVECMSKKAFSASNFLGMYGQHEVILNKMMERLEKGEIKDLYEHFCQPWFGVFTITHWEHFLQELKDLYKVYDIGDGHRIGDLIRDFISSLDNPDSIEVDANIIRSIWDGSGLKQEVELRFLAFLKFHKLALPMYARNDYVEDLLEERSTSTLYYPKNVKY